METKTKLATMEISPKEMEKDTPTPKEHATRKGGWLLLRWTDCHAGTVLAHSLSKTLSSIRFRGFPVFWDAIDKVLSS